MHTKRLVKLFTKISHVLPRICLHMKTYCAFCATPLIVVYTYGEMCTCIHVSDYAHMHISINVYMYVQIYIYNIICVYTSAYMYTVTCICVRAYVCVCVYVYIYIDIHVYASGYA